MAVTPATDQSKTAAKRVVPNPLGHKIRIHEAMIRPSLVAALSGFRSSLGAVSTYYINLDSNATGDPVLAARLAAKNSMKTHREQLEKLEVPGEVRHALVRDWDVVFKAAQLVAGERRTKGLAAFVASADGHALALRLPHSTRDRAFFEPNFVMWPLEQVLDQADRYIVCLTDKDDARVYHYYLNEIELLQEIHDDIPGRVRIPDPFYERHYQGKHERHTHYHYVNVADALLKLFERRKYQRFIIGGLHEELPTVEKHLHLYVKDRIVARWEDVEPKTPAAKVLELCVDQEQRILEQEAEAIWKKIQEQPPERRATGQDEVCRTLWRKVVDKLLVDPNLRDAGSRCQTCSRLQVPSGPCVECGGPTAATPSLQEEAVHDAVEQSAHVRYWKGPALRQAGSLAALKRF